MTDQKRPPLEESPEVADAVADDVSVSAFINGGGADADTPQFREPDFTGGEAEPGWRTGAEQPWEPADLAVAQGRDPTPENIERARRELERDGAAAIEKTVP